MAQALEQASVGATLLVGLIIVIFLLNLIIPGVVPKWAIFAPVFIPIFDRLGVAPQTVLAAYRIGDSPFNVLTPLMVYLAFVVTVAQRYQKDASIGTVVSLMLPTLIIAAVWICSSSFGSFSEFRSGLAIRWGHSVSLSGAGRMSEFLLVLVVASVAALLTYLGAPLAERFGAPQRGQRRPAVRCRPDYGAGSVQPYAARGARRPGHRRCARFFVGGALFVTLEYNSARTVAASPAATGGSGSLGLYIGILVDLVIDGAVIGIGSA